MLSGPGRAKAIAPHAIYVSWDRFTYPGTFVRHPRRRAFHSLRRTSMTKLRRSMTIRCLFLGVLLLAGCSRAPTRSPIAEQLAKTYGLDSFGQIEAIRYTFNLEFPGVNVARSWVWQPKTGQVSYEGKDKDGKLVKATYVRSQLKRQPANVKDEIEPAFVNDQYWLVFPF